MTPRAPRSRLLLTAGLALSLAWPASAAGFSGQAYPLPQRIDREGRLRTGLLLQFDIERYGMGFEEFAGRSLDASESAFREFTRGLLAGDAARVAAFRPGEAEAQTKALVTGYHQFFTKTPARMGVVARVAAGDHQLFVWDWPAPEGRRVYQAFAVEPIPGGGGQRVDIVTSDRPLDTLIVDALQQHQIDPTAYAPVTPQQGLRYVFPVAAGRPGAHPVVLHFDGAEADLEPAAETAAARVKSWPGEAGEVLRAWFSAWRAFEQRDLEGYLAAFTEESGAKLRAAFAAMSAQEIDAYRARASAQQHLRFVLVAPPLALVFFTRGVERRVHYDALVDAGGRGYRLTNAGFEDYLDDVLQHDQLWPTRIESFRKNLLGLTNRK